MIYRYFLDKEYREQIGRNFARLEMRFFRDEFQKVVTEMIGE